MSDGDDSDALSLGRAGAVDPATWFLGPKAENRDVFARLLLKSFQSHAQARIDYAPKDPRFVSEDDMKSASYAKGIELLEERLDALHSQLRSSLPLASYRNQSHMYWDITMPSALGYFTAMLYDQNNVAAEASPVTTALEIAVGEAMCTMLGFGEEAGAPKSWGHITCGGSVANIEAMWAARNLKFFAPALARAIAEQDSLAEARALTVRTLTRGRKRLLDLGIWELLNLPVDEAIGLIERIEKTTRITAETLGAALERYALQNIGLIQFYADHCEGSGCGTPVVFVPDTRHYSWPKAGSLLGLGVNAVEGISLDLDGRMDTRALRRALDRALAERRPVLQVVAVVGSTEEGAVDPLAEILAIREEYREQGLEFAVHADGAWGGYFAAMLRPADPATMVDFLSPPHLLDRRPDIQMSDYVRTQIEAFARADSVTLDPHKSGFVPYPAGGLCYRNGNMREVLTFAAPVVFHGGVDPTVGVYGVEGSKPGAAPAGVFMSHSLIPADRSGYGRLLGRCIFNNKRYHAALLTMPQESDPFTLTVFQRTPAERGGTAAEIAAEREVIRREIAELENDALIAKLDHDKHILHLFQQLGSDLSILTYAFNFKTAAGINRDLSLMNELNDDIFQRLSAHPGPSGHLPRQEMFVTGSLFSPGDYGQAFVDHFATRSGAEPIPGEGVKFLISTTQNPWVTDTEAGNFIPELMKILRRSVTEVTHALLARHGLQAP
ncbi:MAG: decarboxylase [Alphaproteobacteria bacterium]|nr:decarboxylase [Alphaproteobacteria bacterium]NNF25274.1 decarboxylase [Paracoccaceae bacterium]